jgi:pyridinium-3,5-biscarboxylic acid mononucleotide sulfurtransferase
MSDYEKLVSSIKEMGGVVVGYSGGVDSTLVAKAATDALGEKAICVLIDSCFIPRWEIDEAVSRAGQLGFNLVRVNADVLAIRNVPENEPDRCYHCKKAVFSIMTDIAQRQGLNYVLDGTNLDDEGDFRPGERATRELGVRSPLKELGFPKSRVREISKEIGLPTWDKPSYACLASRVPYGTALTRDILGQVEAAESILHELGFKQCRVRHHGDVARIELVPEEMDAIFALETRNLVAYRFRALGYNYVALDLIGYRMGSMNEGLGKD